MAQPDTPVAAAAAAVVLNPAEPGEPARQEDGGPQLSAYELARLDRIRANEAKLVELGITKMKDSMVSELNAQKLAKKKTVSSKRSGKKRVRVEAQGALRKSSRSSARRKVNYSGNWGDMQYRAALRASMFGRERKKKQSKKKVMLGASRYGMTRKEWRHFALSDVDKTITGQEVAYPLKLSSIGVTILSLGKLKTGDSKKVLNKYWSNSGCLFHHPYPIGYSACFNHWNQRFVMTIEDSPDGKSGPVFKVTNEAGLGFVGTSPTNPWTAHCLARRTGERISGPLHFGFSDRVTVRLICQLEGYRELYENKFEESPPSWLTNSELDAIKGATNSAAAPATAAVSEPPLPIKEKESTATRKMFRAAINTDTSGNDWKSPKVPLLQMRAFTNSIERRYSIGEKVRVRWSDTEEYEGWVLSINVKDKEQVEEEPRKKWKRTTFLARKRKGKRGKQKQTKSVHAAENKLKVKPIATLDILYEDGEMGLDEPIYSLSKSRLPHASFCPGDVPLPSALDVKFREDLDRVQHWVPMAGKIRELNNSEILVWEGQWEYGEVNLDFRYALRSIIQDSPVALGSPLPFCTRGYGYFCYESAVEGENGGTTVKRERILEREMQIHIVPQRNTGIGQTKSNGNGNDRSASSSIFDVYGGGWNATFGNFRVRGTYDADSSRMIVERGYVTLQKPATAAVSEEDSLKYVGAHVEKMFAAHAGKFKGTVIEHNSVTGYRIKYEDGDIEDVTHAELLQILL